MVAPIDFISAAFHSWSLFLVSYRSFDH